MKEYYGYGADELMARAKLPVRCMDSSEAVFEALALEMTDLIEANNAQGLHTVIICPVGPVGHYPYFVERVNSRRIDLHNCWFFNMDEYLTDAGDYIDEKDRLSFRGFMAHEVYGRIDPALVMPEAQRIFPDPADPALLTNKLFALGGADLCIGGIGINGHLAFNEPEAVCAEVFAERTARKLEISRETRTANAIGELGGAIEDMPRFAVTIGMKEILSAKRIRLGVFRAWHRAVLRRAACGEQTTEFPVTLAQSHADAAILANRIASEKPV